ncbi:hypothetical protein F3Y22_tig00110328pilonHSYRG00010 [Hibiscus syriacus]|uniref:Uncharacterized protein n=1 Tax=Hibiscus syriacus TaxID=106335 RepID=A0A6A3B1V1_HIBSY|nr:hypothetical protein F3Y22_tig00110328pilonHSYRG00010 [Hibiscus syriacus]
MKLDEILLVYGAGEVVPSSLTILEPNLKYSLFVSISSASQYGRLLLVMGRDFCSDAAGNPFARSPNSTFYVHYGDRSVFVDLRVHVPEKLLKLQSEVRTVQATNNYNNLKVYLYFSVPIFKSLNEILSSLSISQGTLLPIIGEHHGNRRFGFMVANISNIAIITISLNASSRISRQGTPVSPVAPVTFLYGVICRFSEDCSETKQNKSYEDTFHETSGSIYAAEIRADDDVVSVSVPENVTGDVAGNKNLASNVLRVFALIRWLPVKLPVEYYEFARSLERSIPYFSLPWETGHVQPVMMGASPSGTSNSFLSQAYDREISHSFQPKKDDFKIAAAVYGSPLTPIEYRSFFESQSIIPEAEYISDRLHSNGWRNFDRSLFWLVVIGGSLILLHAVLFLILKYKKRDSEKKRSYGALIFC